MSGLRSILICMICMCMIGMRMIMCMGVIMTMVMTGNGDGGRFGAMIACALGSCRAASIGE